MHTRTMAVAAAAALATTGGTASADTGTQPRTIATAGAGNTTVPRTAGQGAVDAAYRQALSQAIDDARRKADFLAQKIGATLAREQTVTEDEGFVDCGDDEQSVGGAGQQRGASAPADSGASVGGQTHGRLRLPPLPKPKPKPKRHKRHKTVKRAVTSTCMVSANVSVTYALA